MKLTLLCFFSLIIRTSRGSEPYGSDWVFSKIGRRSADIDVNWALDRLNERTPLRDGKVSAVAEGDVYIVGSGVRASHSELGDRVLEGFSFDGSDSRVDCALNGYSSGAASVTAGRHLGIARTANIIPVKVGCSDAIGIPSLKEGLNWVQSHISSLPTHRAVIVLPLESDFVGVEQELNLLASHSLVVVPAGDRAIDVCEIFKRTLARMRRKGRKERKRQRGKDSEERTNRKGRKGNRGKDGEEMTARKGRREQRRKDGEERTARKGRKGQRGKDDELHEVGFMIVGSSTATDENSPSSNYGECIDMWAPGDNVTLASSDDDTSTRRASSTLFAAAAVAGTAVDALITMREVGEVDVLKATLLSQSTKGALNLREPTTISPNRLLFDICPYYKRPDHAKCYLAQTTNLKTKSELSKAAKSVVTFDNMAYNYFEDCLTVLMFASSETATRVEATHGRDSNSVIMDAVFHITTASHNISLSSGPNVAVDGDDIDLSSVYHSPSGADYFYVIRQDVEIRTQNENDRFIPILSVFLPKNVTVSFDGHQQIRISIDIEEFREKTEGICGFMDNSHVKEFVDRQGNDMEFTFDKNKRKYIDEWTVLGDEGCPEMLVGDCNETQCLLTAHEVCYPLKDEKGKFSQCFDLLDPSSWHSNCLESVLDCCCNGVDIEECTCTDQLKYWWAAFLEDCTPARPCENPCKKPETDSECVDDTKHLVEFFYKDFISYKPEGDCHYVDKHDTVECNHDGTWNQLPSDCKIKICPAPGMNDRLEITSNLSDVFQCGDEVEYQCKKTDCDCNCFTLLGESKAQCSSNGERTANWTSPPPTCSLNHCAKPLPPSVDKRIQTEERLSWVIDEENLDTSCCSGRAQFACHECYELVGESELGCCNNKWGDGNSPECRLKECSDPNTEVQGSGDVHLVVNAPDLSCSQVITYSCSSSCYEIMGSETRTCQANGSWSGAVPKCEKKKCPSITSYENGQYASAGSIVQEGTALECGDIIHTKCNDCNWPCTSTCERTCKWNGTATVWSNKEPRCQPFNCRQRETANATISTKGPLECGESSEVKCNTCYKQMGGSNTRTCNAPLTNETCPIADVEGVYDGVEIECVEMVCPELVTGDHVQIKEKKCTNEFDCDCTVTFKCDSDCYQMVGESSLRCDGFGWDHQIPECVIKTCPFIKPDFSRKYNYDAAWKPGGCQFVKDGERVQSGAILNCGDIIDVEASHTNCFHVCNKDRLLCQTNGQWNVTETFIPNCMYMECKAPPPVLNAHLTNDCGEYNCSTVLKYECDSCYEHVGGNLTRKCVGDDLSSSPDGRWDGEPPLCEKMACSESDFASVANATVEIRGSRCGGKLVYTCEECSYLVGSNELVCQQNSVERTVASWVNSPPTCEPVCCPILAPVKSDDEDYDVIATGARYLHGPHMMEAVCGDDYVCQKIEAKCDECFEYKSSKGVEDHAPIRQCVKGNDVGYWSNMDKVCTRKLCKVDEIPPENHIFYTNSSTTNKCNQTIELECDCCYKITDEIITDSLQCLPSKVWNKDLPKCAPITCDTPPSLENGMFMMTNTITSCSCGTATYRCDPCFRLVGHSTLTCSQDTDLGTAQWNHPPPVCEPICCEPLDEPIDLVTNTISTSYTYSKDNIGIKVSYEDMSIQENYETCAINHACQVIDAECGKCFEYNRDDARSKDGISHPPSKQCQKQEIEGQLVGKWSNKDKACTLKQCAYREIGEQNNLHYADGYNSETNSFCLSNVTVRCDECFELTDGSRSETHQCQHNKLWSKDLPTCQRSQCPTPPSIEYCSYQSSENLCDHTRTLECDECYYEKNCNNDGISDTMKVKCNYDKSWSWMDTKPEMNIRECPVSPEVENGEVDTTGYSCGDMARYTCNRCYKFSDQSNCLCTRRKCIPDPLDCTKGMWNETAPTCEKITCPNLPSPPTNGQLVDADTSCDGSAVYKCEEGYYLTDGDLTRNCTEYGTWSGKHPVCSIKKCTSIKDSANRSHYPLDNTYGTLVIFSCEKCYEFSNNAIDERIKNTESIYPRFHLILCEATGNWNGSAPICKKKRCPSPAPVANGRLIDDVSFYCGDTITYQCNEGYVFKEGSTPKRTCEGEKWTNTPPECIPVDCGDVNVNIPLVAQYLETLYGYDVSYVCGKNNREKRCYYEPTPHTGICQANGQWETGPDRCDRMQCDDLPEIKNAQVTITFNRLQANDCGQQFMVKCDEGYKIQGSPWIKCKETSWFPTILPSCSKQECKVQPSPANGIVTPSLKIQSKEKVYYESTLLYSCDKCYALDGAQLRQCSSDGRGSVTWSALQPTCIKVECALPIIIHGRVSNGYSDTDLPGCGDVVNFECNEGYKLSGSTEATCTEAETFDTNTILPTCVEVKCPFPAQREHMITTSYPPTEDGIYKPNTEIEYECEDDWELKESYDIITCQNDGTWTDEPPVCIPHMCDETIFNGLQNMHVTNVTDVHRSIKCNECYRPTNPSATDLRCSNGQWEPPSPTQCEVIKCGNPGKPEFGLMSDLKLSYHCRDSVTFSCEEGFAIIGSSTLTCQVDGTWDNTFPACVEKNCPELEEVKNAKTNFTMKGQQVHYECFEGFELYGDSVRRCFNGSQWSGPGVTSCKVKHCGSIGDILFGKVEFIRTGKEEGVDTPGAKAQYSCQDDRYQLIGEDIRECQNNKQWSFVPPECKCVSCPVLSILNGRVETADENKVGTSVQYICDTGYKLIPDDQNYHSRSCLESGVWDGIAPKCQRITCGHPQIPDGGRMETNLKSEYHYVEKVNIICEPWKYKIVYTCGENGHWTGDTDKSCTTCKEVTKEVVTHMTKVIPGVCILGMCLQERTTEVPVTTYETEIECS